MNKQFSISVVVVVVMLVGFGVLVHAVLLSADYAPLTQTTETQGPQPQPRLYRPTEEQNRLVPLMLPAHICAAIAIVWLYRRDRTPRPWLPRGVAFGFAIAAIMPLHKFLVYYALQPLPAALAVKQIVFDGIVSVLIGMVVARLNR